MPEDLDAGLRREDLRYEGGLLRREEHEARHDLDELELAFGGLGSEAAPTARRMKTRLCPARAAAAVAAAAARTLRRDAVGRVGEEGEKTDEFRAGERACLRAEPASVQERTSD